MSFVRAAIRRNAWVILAIGLIAGLLLRVEGTLLRPSILTHDEAISLLVATGHQAEFHEMLAQKTAPYAQWVPASEWKRLIEPEQRLCFREIYSGLVQYDIHPPLYFWILHLGLLSFGTHLTTGILLNGLFDCMALVAMYALAARVLDCRWKAAYVAVFWFVLFGIAFQTATVARQYSLLGLLTIGLAYCAVRWHDEHVRLGPVDLALPALLTLAGFLTHYHFSIVAAGTVVCSFITLRPTQPKRFAALAVGIGLGALVAWIFLPDVLQQITRQQQQAVGPGVSAWDVARRMYRMVQATGALLAGLALALLVVGRPWHRSRVTSINRGAIPGTIRWSATQKFVGLMNLWVATFLAVLYLSYASPGHAMGGKYLVLLYPFAAFIPAGVAGWTTCRPWQFYAASCSGTWLFTALAISWTTATTPSFAIPPERLAGSVVRAVVDNPLSGFVLPTVWCLKDNSMVYVASVPDLLDAPQRWLPELRHDGCLLGWVAYNLSEDDQHAVIQMLTDKYEIKITPPPAVRGTNLTIVRIVSNESEDTSKREAYGRLPAAID